MTYKECYGEDYKDLDSIKKAMVDAGLTWGDMKDGVKVAKEFNTRDGIVKVGEGLTSLLLYKNEKYGDTALNPLNVMSKSPALEKLLIRADDKISRIKNSTELRPNDVIDLMGYLTLICVHQGWDNFDKFKD